MDYSSLFGFGLGALVGALLVFAILLLIAIYVYTSLAWMTIAKKLKYKYPWLAWIPLANVAMILQLGEFHWALVFLLLIPVIGWLAVIVLGTIALWRIYEKRKYPGWLALIGYGSLIPAIGWLASIASLVIMGLVAWKDK